MPYGRSAPALGKPAALAALPNSADSADSADPSTSQLVPSRRAHHDPAPSSQASTCLIPYPVSAGKILHLWASVSRPVRRCQRPIADRSPHTAILHILPTSDLTLQSRPIRGEPAARSIGHLHMYTAMYSQSPP